jgi:hypothetical protein
MHLSYLGGALTWETRILFITYFIAIISPYQANWESQAR